MAEIFLEYTNPSQVPFQPIKTLGHGGYGYVEEVCHISSGTVFARKSIRIRASQATDITEAVQKEVAIVQRLRHAHIVTIHSAYREPKLFGIIMSPVADGDFDWFFEKRADESFPAELLSLLRVWFSCLSDALAYIHSQNVRHKDIKPGNILVQANLVYFTDFGLATDFDPEITSSTEGYVF
jgi:serine/threonine protein kinase